MPWNDTAQLNYLSRDVQEAVYQTILEVARKFPIIRFDAAMLKPRALSPRPLFQGYSLPGSPPSSICLFPCPMHRLRPISRPF